MRWLVLAMWCIAGSARADDVELELRAGVGAGVRIPATTPPPPGRIELRGAAVAAIGGAVDLLPREDLRFRFGVDYVSTLAATMRERTGDAAPRSVRVRGQSLGGGVLAIGRVVGRPRGALWLGGGPHWAFEPFGSPVHPATQGYALFRVGVEVPLFGRWWDDRIELGVAPWIDAALGDARAYGSGLARIGWSIGGQAWARVAVYERLGVVLAWRGRHAAIGGARSDAFHTVTVGLSLRVGWR